MSDRIILRRVCNKVVTPIPDLEPVDKRPVLGADMLPEVYSNILVFAKKKSGKTTAIWNIIKNCINQGTTIHAFVSTLFNDKGWRAIRQICQKRGIVFNGYTSLIVDGINKLDELVNQLEYEAFEREMLRLQKLKGKKKPTIILCDDDDDDEDEPKKKSKYQVPEHLIILDDMSKLSRNKSVAQLIKQNRHYHAKVIISSQGVLDAMPDVRGNADYWLIFRGMTPKALEEILDKTELPISQENFNEAYRISMIPTKQNPKPFLYIDTNLQKLRKSFLDEIVYDKNKIQNNNINAAKSTETNETVEKAHGRSTARR